jgi:hypothetical protein
LCSTLTRLAHRIGINRVPREIEPPGSYLERKYAATAAAEEDMP